MTQDMTYGHKRSAYIIREPDVGLPYVSPCIMSEVLITVHGLLDVHRKHNVTHSAEQQMTSETRCRHG